MLVLALDTATTRITVGVVALDPAPGAAPRTLAEVEREGARAHAELLAPAITAALGEAGAARGDLDALVCGVGPGPFTGLRVGMVTAAALGDGLGLPVHGVSTHAALLHDAATDSATDVAPAVRVAVTDARRREWYWAVADLDGTVTGPVVSAPADLVAHLASRSPDPTVDPLDADDVLAPVAVGDAAPSLAELVDALAVGDRPAPSPGALVAVAAPALRAAAEPGPLVPLYLRRPDAVPPGAPKAVRR